MSSNKSVIVLTPNGRRKTVHVTPNTTILQILEEVCLKENLPPDEYDLKHHREVLDTTTTLQFSGLPNNALVEMIPLQRVRKESSVTLGFQLESGERLTGTFLPSDSLWTVVTKLCPEEQSESKEGSNPVVIYMRQEIAGVEALKGATLRHLGLTGGRAMLRFVHRTPDELRTQANVSAPLKRVQATPKETTREKQAKPLGTLHAPETASGNVPAEDPMVLQEQVPPPSTRSSEAYSAAQGGSVELESTAESEMEVDTLEEGVGRDRIESYSAVGGHHVNGESGMCVNEDTAPDGSDNKPILLGERNAVVFLMDTAPEVLRDDLPDSFFDLTVEDARIIYNDLINKRAELEDAPLSTSAMRELEKSKQILNSLHQYRKVVLRIQFPDRTVLQGIFSPVETVQKVTEFVKQYLKNPNILFHLYTTPPKQILQPELTLAEAGCVPNALLHFGCDTCETGYFIRPDILSQSSSFTAATAAARYSRHTRGKTLDSCPVGGSNLCEERTPSPQPSTSSQSDDAPFTQEHKAHVNHNKDTKKVPKWFKLT